MENLDDLVDQLRDKAADIPIEFDETDAQDDVDGLGDSLESLSMLAVGDVLQQYGSGAEAMAQDMNTAAISVGQLATNAGVAEPQMVSLINHISNATFPQNEAMAYATALNQMGVSANQLGESATNMDRINDATGIGYQKTMQLTQGLQSVGVSANNLPSAFNAIAYAQANVNGGADTLTMVLKRQASTINEYGLNTDQLVLIMQKLSEQGVQGMKMGSELSKVLKETNGDTTALEQSLGLATGTLSNASQVTGQYEGQLQNLANEEAEHKTILDQVGAAWEDLSLSLSGIMEPFMGVIGLGGEMAGFGMQMNGTWELLSKFSQLGPVSSAITTIKSALLGLIPTQWAEAAAGWASIGWIALAIAAGLALGYAIVWLWNNCDWFREGLLNLYRTGVAVWNGLLNGVRNLASGISNAFNSIRNMIIGCLQGIADWIMSNPIIKAIWDMGASMVGAIKNALGIGSPGYMYYMVKGEYDRIDNLTQKTKFDTGSIGQGMVDSFNKDISSGSSNIGGAASGNNITINIESVDNEERIQQIVEAVEKALAFDNLTAGRSV